MTVRILFALALCLGFASEANAKSLQWRATAATGGYCQGNGFQAVFGKTPIAVAREVERLSNEGNCDNIWQSRTCGTPSIADGDTSGSVTCSGTGVRSDGHNETYSGPVYWQCPAGETYLTAAQGCVSGNKLAANNGCESCPKLHVGNPINSGTGNKAQAEFDYAAGGAFPLTVVRTYNSGADSFVPEGLGGKKWRFSFERNTRAYSHGGNDYVALDREDGKVWIFQKSGGTYVANADVVGQLTEVLNGSSVLIGYKFVNANDETEIYLADGRISQISLRNGLTQTYQYDSYDRLISITDPFGRKLLFAYTPTSLIWKITLPGGNVIEYGYTAVAVSGVDVAFNLTSVTYPDSATRTYSYNESSYITGSTNLPHALTGITDELSTRFASYYYQADGKAIRSEHAGGVEATYVAYSAGTSTITDALGEVRSLGVSPVLGIVRPDSLDKPFTKGGLTSTAYTYDANGNLASRLDFNGNKSCHGYDTGRNLETRRVEGLGSGATCSTFLSGTATLSGVQRMISTSWSTDWRLPTSIAEPLRITSNTYGAANATNPGDRGSLLSKSVQATLDTSGATGTSATTTGSPQVWAYTYNANGQVLTVNGPRTDVTDVTTYTYYADNDADHGKRGNVATITNAVGHVTYINGYNAHAQPTIVVDPNGVATELAYDTRQRLVSRVVGNETTSYTYDNAGQLTVTTLPDGSTLTYTYDSAHRLTAVTDSAGNKISYTLDLQGNRTAERVYDPANTLVQTRSNVYSTIGRLTQQIGASSQTTAFTYDGQGNVVTVTDPRSQVTTNSYDALNRLVSVTQPAPVTGSAPVIAYAYSGLDQLTQVTDPRSLATTYSYDGLSNLNSLASPDTGTTVNTYDLAGNLLTSTDAKGQVTTFTYDAANRVATIVYNQATGSQLKTVANTYDQGTNGKGRLTTVTETAANTTVLQTTQYAYDQMGRLISETRTLNGNTSPYVTAYSFDPFSGRLLTMTYPSGRTLSYSYDALGRITQIGTTAPSSQGGQTQLLVFSVAYHPFGGVKGYTLGNNRSISRPHDQDGRISSYTLGGTSITVGYDAASRITSLLDTVNAGNSTSYGYDNLDRLTSASVPATSYSYAYDLTGNRTSRTAGAATDTTTINSASNRITQVAGGSTRSYTYDSNGSTIADGNNTYSYDPRGRMISAVNGGTTTAYQVSSQGQRVRKTNTGVDTVFHYDAQGKLIAETTPAGVVSKEYLYLLDMPVAVNVQ